MKKSCVVFVFAFFSLNVYLFPQDITLDEAIKNSAKEISARLERNSTIAILNFDSKSSRFSRYVIDEINSALVNIGQLKSVERLKLETLQMELNFNMTGAVNDESAQAIGRMLGAQYILSGSLEQLGDKYRIRFRAISVETAVIQYSYSENIQNDDIVQYLMADGSYTKKERMEHAALNLAFGTGSFLWDDKFGGGITAVAEGVGVAGMAFGLIYGSGESLLREEMKAYPFFIGAGLYVGGAIFGAIRALTYNQTGANISYKHIDGFNIGFVSTNNSNIEVQISYKMYY